MKRNLTALAVGMGLVYMAGAQELGMASSQEIAMPTPPPPENLYSVELGTFQTVASAEDCRAEFERLGYSPVFILRVDSQYVVCFGRFDVYVDAALYLGDLQHRLEREELSIRTTLPRAAESSSTNTGPLRPIFRLEASSITDTPDISLVGNAVYDRLESLRQAGNIDSYRRALAIEVSRESRAADAITGYLSTRQGIEDLLQGRYDTALARLRPVADGEVASNRVSRIQAMIRVAWILREQRHRLQAYQAYREIERFTGSDTVRARCRTEYCGLLLELMFFEHFGSWEDAHRACVRALRATARGSTESQIKFHTLLRLITLESCVWVGDNEAALGMAEELIADSNGNDALRREVAWAWFWKGDAYRAMGRRDESVAAYEQVIAMNLRADEDFAEERAPLSAASRLFQWAERDGDLAAMDQWSAFLGERFPDTTAGYRYRRVYLNAAEATAGTATPARADLR